MPDFFIVYDFAGVCACKPDCENGLAGHPPVTYPAAGEVDPGGVLRGHLNGMPSDGAHRV